jgi:hypothetical protein
MEDLNAGNVAEIVQANRIGYINMPVNVTVNDDRWQFIAGNKYWVIGTLRIDGSYVTGGIPVAFTPNPFPPPSGIYRDPGPGTIKASRAPWFAVIPGIKGYTFNYISPSQRLSIDPPNTVGTTGRENATTFVSEPSDINDGLLQIFSGADELQDTQDLERAIPPTTGLFIFQGME